MSKILLVGDISSVHIYNYISNVLSYTTIKVTLYNIAGATATINPAFKNFYANRGIDIIDGVSPEIIKERGGISFVKESVAKVKELGKFDYLHLKGIPNFISPVFFITRKLYNIIIVTYWGSDLYRVNIIQRLQTLPLLLSSDIITFMSEDMLKYFSKLPWPYKYLIRKCKVMDYGSMLYDRIDSYKSTIDTLKREFNISPEKIVCTIGYVGRPQMQQRKTIESILDFIKKNKDSIFLAVPAYGITNNNFHELHEVLSKSKVEYAIYPEFMDIERVSKFRCITDIFIHAQTTDALSSAMLEHLYAGSVVLNGSWLEYSILSKIGVYYKTFCSFQELSCTLETILKNLNEEKLHAKDNREKIASISSWSRLQNKWLELYK